MSFAEAVFDAERQKDRLEGVLCGALRDFFRRANCWTKRFDHYDSSVEFWVSPGMELTDEEQAVLWILGFWNCWLVESKDADNDVEESNGTERHYYRKPLISQA